LTKIMKLVCIQLILVLAANALCQRPLGYRAEIAAWRGKHEADLKSDTSWLTLAGLFWLKPGKNTIGAGPGYDVQLTSSFTQGKFGELDLHDAIGTLTVENGVTATVAGDPVTRVDLVWDEKTKPPVVRTGTQSLSLIKRGERYAIRLRDTNSDVRSNFTHEKWFPADPRYRIKARFERYPEPADVLVPNVLGENFKEKAPGLLHFRLGGKSFTLQPVIEEDHLFIIFKDLTSKTTTYGAGRFLYAAYPTDGDTVILDFNKAENPPCAFTAFATCPLPPRQNRLPVAIPAGEKRYGNH